MKHISLPIKDGDVERVRHMGLYEIENYLVNETKYSDIVFGYGVYNGWVNDGRLELDIGSTCD